VFGSCFVHGRAHFGAARSCMLVHARACLCTFVHAQYRVHACTTDLAFFTLLRVGSCLVRVSCTVVHALVHARAARSCSCFGARYRVHAMHARTHTTDLAFFTLLLRVWFVFHARSCTLWCSTFVHACACFGARSCTFVQHDIVFACMHAYTTDLAFFHVSCLVHVSCFVCVHAQSCSCIMHEHEHEHMHTQLT
jgi:hypothetical protein